jgi:hypothetical protein
MNDKLGDLNGRMDENNVVCRRCPARLTEDGEVHRQGGGFSPAHGILICANEMRDRKHLEDTLAHEMVHAWDHLRWQVDWMGDLDLKHAACTEVRCPFLSSLRGYSQLTSSPPDPGFDAQRRVQMDETDIHKGQLEALAGFPGLRAGPGRTVSTQSAAMQGRGPGVKGRQPSVGLLLLRHAALRRGVQVMGESMWWLDVYSKGYDTLLIHVQQTE